MPIRKIIILSFLALSLCLAAGAEARVYLDITSPDYRKVPMAIPYFVDKLHPDQNDKTGRELAGLLSEGLGFHGFINVLPSDSYKGSQDTDWRALGADFVILGHYSLDQTAITMELRLLNILEGQLLIGRRYHGPLEKREDMVLRFCDEAILQLTGERGISLSQIAFISDASGSKEVYVADALGRHIRQITRHDNLVVSPRFSPDGSQLTYTSYHRDKPVLYVTDLSQDKTTRPISWRDGLNHFPAWSPDGKTMVVTLSEDGNPDLYLTTARKMKSGEAKPIDILERLTINAGINVSPSWSPDGRRLAFVSNRSGTPQIYIMDMTSKAVTRLTYQGTYNTDPSWSPKGDWIAYAGRDEGSYHIFIIRPEGGTPLRLTNSQGNHESPSWSPDGRQIVFSRTRNDKQQLCVMLKNGSGIRVLFPGKGKQSQPQWSAVRLDL